MKWVDEQDAVFSLVYPCPCHFFTLLQSRHRSLIYLSLMLSCAPYKHGRVCPPVTDGFLYKLWFSSILSMPGESQQIETLIGGWLTTTLSPILVPSPSFFWRNGANVQPCGQLTGRPGPYANFMMAETNVCSARCWNDVSIGVALLLTLISAELLTINRVRVCF